MIAENISTKQEVKIMSTSLVLVDTETSAFKYMLAIVFFTVDMMAIDRGIALETSYDPTAMNLYIDEAISLLH